METTNILGRGAVRDTCNLLADGIVKLLRGLVGVEEIPVRQWAEALEYARYLGSSIKGESDIDWSNKKAWVGFLAMIVADAGRLLEVAWEAQEALSEGSPERQGIVAAAELLGQLLLLGVGRTGWKAIREPTWAYFHRAGSWHSSSMALFPQGSGIRMAGILTPRTHSPWPRS